MAGERGIHRRLEFELTNSLITRFRSKAATVDETTGCWNWAGALRNGYGAIKHKGRVLSAHVVSYRIAHGDIPEGHVIRHSCDNRQCVNPDHLSTGTPGDNIDDARRTGAMVSPRGEELPHAVLTEDQVRLIRAIRTVEGIGATRIARRMGLSVSSVAGVLYYGNWSHVPTPGLEQAKQLLQPTTH